MTECLAPDCHRRVSKDAAFCGLHQRRAVYAEPYGDGVAPSRRYVAHSANFARQYWGTLSDIELRALRKPKGSHHKRCSVCKKRRSTHAVWADQAKTTCGFCIGRSL